MNVNEEYVKLAKKIIDNGYDEEKLEKDIRPRWSDGKDAFTKYLPQQVITYDKDVLPLITLRKIAWRSAIKEILRIYQDKSNDVGLLKDKYNVKYRDSWANEEGNLGSAYGYQINKEFISPENGKTINQIDRLINELRENPLNRRLIMSLYDVDDLSDMTLIPCAFLTMRTVTEDHLNMTLIQRSGDFLAAAGPGSINAFQYYALLRMIAQVTGYKAGNFLHFIQNAHIYKRHIPIVEEIIDKNYKDNSKPFLNLNPGIKEFKDFTIDDFELIGYNPDDTNYSIDIAI